MKPMGNREWLCFWWGRSERLYTEIMERGGQGSLGRMTSYYNREDMESFYLEAERIGLIREN
jgi:hypothetical protein